MKDLKSQAYSVGLVGMSGKLRNYDTTDGLSDRFNDVGLDASWQYLGTRQHVFAVNASYLRETQHLDATYAAGGADRAKQTLDEYRLAASYHYAKTYGVSLGYFDIRGSKDSTLWGDGALNGDGSVKGIGSTTSRPNSAGWIAQADWTPFGKGSLLGRPLGQRPPRPAILPGTTSSTAPASTSTASTATATPPTATPGTTTPCTASCGPLSKDSKNA